MTKHDDDAAERAQRLEPVPDLVERYRALEQENAGLVLELNRARDIIVHYEQETAGLVLELNRAREIIAYYRNLSTDRFGFAAEPPPGSMLSE